MATKITFLSNFHLGLQLVRDALFFFERLYQCLVMLSEYTIVP